MSPALEKVQKSKIVPVAEIINLIIFNRFVAVGEG
jgi:hypothetical protein